MELLRTRLCTWAPSRIDALALAPSIAPGICAAEPRLAVGRANGAVELWDTTTWHMQLASLGYDKRDIRAVLWVRADIEEGSAPGLRLFTAGLNGEIAEWNLQTLDVRASVASGGGPIWAMCALQQRLFLTCEDGSVRIFSIEGGHDEIFHMRRVVVGQTRLLSIAPFGSDFIFVGGSDSKISKWSLASCVCESRMQVEKTGKDQETLVWSLACLGDHGIASGDSLGVVTIWDPMTCVVLHRFLHHQADVLCLAATDDGNVLISGGIDAEISTYCRQPSNEQVWFFRSSDIGHTHDIRAVALDITSEDRKHIVSGGVAGRILVHNLKISARAKRGRPLRSSAFSSCYQRATLAEASRLVMCQHNAQLELHYLHPPKSPLKSNPDGVASFPGSVEVPPSSLPEPQLLVRHSLARAAEGHHLGASAITRDARLFAASDCSGTRLFRLNVSELEVRRERNFPDALLKVAARAMLFCGEKFLIVAAWDTHKLYVVDVQELKVVARFSEHSAAVTLLASGGEWLASGDISGGVHLFTLDSLRHQARVPAGSPHEFPTALSFDSAGKLLFIAFSTHKVLVYDIEAQMLASSMPSLISVPAELLSKQDRICGVVKVPGQAQKLLLHGHNFLLALDLDQLALVEAENEAKSKVRADAEETIINEIERPTKRRKNSRKAAKAAKANNILFIGDATSLAPCVWRNYSKMGMKYIFGLWALDASCWGNALLENRFFEPFEPDSRTKSNQVTTDEPSENQRRMDIKSMMLTLEVAPETVELSMPAAFEKRKFATQ